LIPDPVPRLFPLINEFARDTPWLHPVMIGYAEYAAVVFAALLLAGWWIARRRAGATGPILVRLLRRAEEIRLVRPLLTAADTAELPNR
jgi:hypothetical protein